MVKITELSQQQAQYLRVEGCVLLAPEQWDLPRGPCPIKTRLYWYQVASNQGSTPDDWALSLPLASIPQPGELWRFNIRGRPVTGRLNDGGYDYQQYLVRHRIRLTGTIREASRVSSASPWLWQFWRNRLFYLFAAERDDFAYSDILLALSLGERQWVSAERWQLLQRTGLAHLMAISGLHLGLVFAGAVGFARVLVALIQFALVAQCFVARYLVMSSRWLKTVVLQRVKLLKKQPLRIATTAFSWKNKTIKPNNFAQQRLVRYFWATPVIYLSAWLLTLIYAALAGFSVATVRAFILISLFVVSQLSRSYLSRGRLFLFAVVLVILVDPFAWLDAGFWLSAGAVWAILLWQWRGQQPQGSNRTKKYDRGHQVVKALVHLWRFELMLLVTLAPLSLLFFQGIPWLAPLTNVVAIPVFTFLILPVLLVSLCCALLGINIYLPLWSFLELVLKKLFVVIEYIAQQPWVWGASMHPWPILYAGAFILWYLWPQSGWYAVRVSGLFVLLGLPWFLRQPSLDFALHVLDVGQGSAIVVQRGEKALLFDAGPAFSDGFDAGAQVIIPFLRYHQLQPEWLIISHQHNDHRGGAVALQQAYSNLLTIGNSTIHRNSTQSALKLTQAPCAMGQSWWWQGVHIQILAPMPGPSYGENNASCVMLLTYQGQRVLFPADSEWQNELRLKGRYGHGLKAEVLMVPHHGSKSSSQADFLAYVQPEIAVISRGLANQFGMPAREVLARYATLNARVYDTAEAGQVSLIWQAEQGWQVKQQRAANLFGQVNWYHALPQVE